MDKLVAVIGAAFGDEGKGRLVDNYVEQELKRGVPPGEIVVIRNSGGANAGHTVIRDGKRHVFGHFGSGSLLDVSTYLGPRFIVNPFLFNKEYDQLKELIGAPPPAVFCDSSCKLTTHWDMLINEMLETKRGSGRHGSVGVGINETMKRSERFPLYIADVHEDSFDIIEKEWLPMRLEELGLTEEDDPQRWEWLHSRQIRDQYFYSFDEMCSKLYADFDRAAIRDAFDTGVYEGSQGLLLDQDSQFFPHVTHAKTGVDGAVAIAKAMGISIDTVTYVMRPYMTRHGAGPLPTEVDSIKFNDETNQPNEWQGSLRFGVFDVELVAGAIADDLSGVETISPPDLFMTCTDHAPYGGSGLMKELQDELAKKGLNMKFVGFSRGPSSEDFHFTGKPAS